MFLGTTHILGSAAHPTNAPSLKIWHHLKGKWTGFPMFKIYCQEALIQQRNNLPNIHLLTFCAMFMTCFVAVSFFFVRHEETHTCVVLELQKLPLWVLKFTFFARFRSNSHLARLASVDITLFFGFTSSLCWGVFCWELPVACKWTPFLSYCNALLLAQS